MHFKWAGAASLAGMLLGAGFLLPGLWFLALVGIVPLLAALKESRAFSAAALYGWITSFVISLLALAPIFWGTLPLDWYGISSSFAQWFLVGGSWVLASAVLALGGGVFGALVYWYGSDSWKSVFFVPAAWVVSEWLGSFVFSVIGAGPGSLVGAHFTLHYIGYILANDPPLLQLAWLGDVYALSFAAVAIGVLTYRAIYASSVKERRALSVCAVLIICVWIAAYPLVVYWSSESHAAAENSASSLSFAAVSRYAPPLFLPSGDEERQRFEALRTLIAPLQTIDVLVFPENAVYLGSVPEDENVAVGNELRKIGVNGKPPLSIDSEDIREARGFLYSRLAYTGEEGRVVYSYKQFLLPLGEYMPYVYRVLLKLFSGEALLERVVRVRGYAQGPFADTVSFRGAELGARFCDEAMSPELYRQQVVNGAHVLVNLSSQSWFHGSRLVYEEMKQVARVRAVSLGRWYVQSGNMAPAFVLDQYGQLVGETQWGIPQTLSMQVPIRDDRTPYFLFGAWMPLVLVGLLLGTLGYPMVINSVRYWRT